MYYKQVEDNGNSRTVVNTWLGYNHNYNINNGEFYDMENMSAESYPLLSPRKIRPLLYKCNKTLRGALFTDNTLAYLDGNKLHYSLSTFNLSSVMAVPTEWQTLVRFGAYIVIFPVGVYVNLYDATDFGTLYTKYDVAVGTTITYSICDSEGNGYDNISASAEAPSSPVDGQYWLKTSNPQGLYMWQGTQSSWTPVATCYIRIGIPNATLNNYFKEGDTVTLNSTISDINDGSTIQKMDNTYLVVIGIMDEVTKSVACTDAWHLTLTRKIPSLDYVCVDKNRIWGCHYGYKNGEMINEIYASKLGDFKNWYTYTGISTDSYAATIGIEGEFTGCVSFGGYPTFFKENAIIRVYGSQPSEYQINYKNQRGVQQGSSRSIAIVNESLIYKSAKDICAYDGSSPVSISEALGNINYYDAVGGGCNGLYRVEMQDAKGAYHQFTYDMEKGIWNKEDAVAYEFITGSESGQLYGANKSEIYGLGNEDNMLYITKQISEEWVDWWCETGEIGYENIDKKFVSRITVRAYVPTRSELQVMISYDNRPFEDVGIVRGFDDINSKNIEIAPYRCDHFRIKFRGHGDCRIYSMAITMDTGSEEYGL